MLFPQRLAPGRVLGFTLLETLVALAVVGIAMAAAMRSTRFAVDTVADLRTRTAAAWVAQNLAGELRAARAFPEMGAASGRASRRRSSPRRGMVAPSQTAPGSAAFNRARSDGSSSVRRSGMTISKSPSGWARRSARPRWHSPFFPRRLPRVSRRVRRPQPSRSSG